MVDLLASVWATFSCRFTQGIHITCLSWYEVLVGRGTFHMAERTTYIIMAGPCLVAGSIRVQVQAESSCISLEYNYKSKWHAVHGNEISKVVVPVSNYKSQSHAYKKDHYSKVKFFRRVHLMAYLQVSNKDFTDLGLGVWGIGNLELGCYILCHLCNKRNHAPLLISARCCSTCFRRVTLVLSSVVVKCVYIRDWTCCNHVHVVRPVRRSLLASLAGSRATNQMCGMARVAMACGALSIAPSCGWHTTFFVITGTIREITDLGLGSHWELRCQMNVGPSMRTSMNHYDVSQ